MWILCCLCCWGMSHSYNKIWEEFFWALVLSLMNDWGLVAGFYGANELYKGTGNRFLAYCGRLQVCSSPDEHWRAPGELCRNKLGCLIILPFPNCWCFGEPQAAFGACCWEIYCVRWGIGFEVSSAQYSITDSVYVVLLASVSFFLCPWLWYQLIFSIFFFLIWK